MYFFKKVYVVCQKLENFSRIFALNIILQSVRLLLTVSYRKNWGAECTSCSPSNFVGMQLQVLVYRVVKKFKGTQVFT